MPVAFVRAENQKNPLCSNSYPSIIEDWKPSIDKVANLAEKSAKADEKLDSINKSLNDLKQQSEKQDGRLWQSEKIEQNPRLTQRLLSAAKAGSLAAIESMLNHPAASFVMAAIEDLNEE